MTQKARKRKKSCSCAHRVVDDSPQAIQERLDRYTWSMKVRCQGASSSIARDIRCSSYGMSRDMIKSRYEKDNRCEAFRSDAADPTGIHVPLTGSRFGDADYGRRAS